MNTSKLTALFVFLTASCAQTATDGTEFARSNGQDSGAIVAVAQTFANQIMDAEQPALTEAVSKLPPETQALAQAAYAALQRGLDEAIAQGIASISSYDRAVAQSALEAIGSAAETLHNVLHNPNTPPPVQGPLVLPAAATPNFVLQAPASGNLISDPALVPIPGPLAN